MFLFFKFCFTTIIWYTCFTPILNTVDIYSLFVSDCFDIYLGFLSINFSQSSSDRLFKPKRYNRKEHGFCSFSCSGPQVWNELIYSHTIQPFLHSKAVSEPTFLTSELFKFFHICHFFCDQDLFCSLICPPPPLPPSPCNC